MRAHQILLSTRVLLDGPDDGVAVRVVYDGADGGFERRGVHIPWDWDHDLHVIRDGSAFELRLCLDHVLYARVTVRLHHGLHPYQWLHLWEGAWGDGGTEGRGTGGRGTGGRGQRKTERIK